MPYAGALRARGTGKRCVLAASSNTRGGIARKLAALDCTTVVQGGSVRTAGRHVAQSTAVLRLPFPRPHSLHDGFRAEVVQISGSCCNTGVAKLLGDYPHVDAFCPHFASPGVAEPVRMDTFVDAGLSAQPGKQTAAIAGR